MSKVNMINTRMGNVRLSLFMNIDEKKNPKQNIRETNPRVYKKGNTSQANILIHKFNMG